MRKNHKREYRLSAAKKWIETFSGMNIVKSYSKKFSVDKLCAIKELQMIGVEISAEYERQLINSMKDLSEQRRFLREKWDNESCEFESD
jgi:hypothetical protein